MLLQPEPKTQTRRIVAPAAVGVLMTFLWSGQLALATSSCAGTRAEHTHEHPQSTCETTAATPAHGAAHAHDAAHSHGAAHAHGAPHTAGASGAQETSDEAHVIVLRGGEAKVVKRGDAAAEIGDAWRAAVEAEPQVIVIGPDGEKRVHGMKLRRSQGAEVHGEAQGHGGVWRFHKTSPDGQTLYGWVEPLEGKKYQLQFDQGQWAELGKLYGETYKKGLFGAHVAPRSAEGRLHPGAAASGQDDLDALRRELEETRAALEEQRQALEELRQQLEQQRSKKPRKAESVGALMP